MGVVPSLCIDSDALHHGRYLAALSESTTLELTLEYYITGFSDARLGLVK
jgi:hypothetical protein